MTTRPRRVHADHAVLLGRHRDRVSPAEQPLPGLLQRGPPGGRITLGAGRVRGVSRPTIVPSSAWHSRTLVDCVDESHPSHEHR